MKTRFLLSVLLALNPMVIQGQPLRLQSPQLADTQMHFQFWSSKGDHLTQLALPVTYIYPHNDKLRLYATTYPAMTSAGKGGNDFSLSGLSDIKLGGHYLTLNDELLLTFGLNIPTGKNSLSSDEIPVASLMALPAFELPVSMLGQGLDIQLGMNTAWEWGDYIVGYGTSFIYKGAFAFFDGSGLKYDPGNELTITWGAQKETRCLGRDMRITADMMYTAYATDRLNDEKVFSSGNRLLLQMRSRFNEGLWDITVLLRETIKSPNRFGNEPLIPAEAKNANGNRFQALVYGFYPYRPDLRLRAVLDLKLFANNDFDVGGAMLAGLGGGAEKKLSPQMTGTAECRTYFGSLKQSANATFVFGFKIMGGIRYEF